MNKMPYLKGFTGVLTGLALISLIATGSASQEVQTSVSDAFREASKAQRKASTSPTIVEKSANTLEAYYSEKLDQLAIKQRSGAEHRSDSKPTKRTSERCKSIVYRTLMQLPNDHRKQLSELTLFYTNDGRRGLGGNQAIVLRCLKVTEGELAAVLIHEIGHLVDASLLTGSSFVFSGFYDFEVPVSEDDPSAQFYKITWDSESQKKSGTTQYDFVSLYAMTDPFEDFAETYTYYRLHGPAFKKLGETNEALKKKYDFMKNVVFNGQEFDALYNDALPEVPPIWERNYDTTVLPYPVKNFLS